MTTTLDHQTNLHAVTCDALDPCDSCMSDRRAKAAERHAARVAEAIANGAAVEPPRVREPRKPLSAWVG